jgi:RNA recognition motif-containing protein
VRSKATKEIRIRVPKVCLARRDLPRFGEAKLGEENVTLRSNDFINMEHPQDQIMEEADDSVFGKTLLASISNKMAQKDATDDKEKDEELPSEKTTTHAAKYVAPGARGGAAASSSSVSGEKDGTETTLRVSNLSKNVSEDDMYELFGRFGRIHRLSLPKVENAFGEKIPRGFAYVGYFRREDAEAAMAALDGHGYDHLILKIEWAKPNAGGGGGGGGMNAPNVYRSGYGQKLAQDTTEKAVFHSTKGS